MAKTKSKLSGSTIDLKQGSELAEVHAIDDASLVERARLGEERAEEILVQRHLPELARVVGRFARTKQDAEDIVQDALIKALATLPTLRDPTAFRGWLLRIGVNEARMMLRRQRFGRLLGINPGPAEISLEQMASSMTSPEIRTELRLLDKVLRKLSVTEQIIWTLRYVEGYSLKEIADACNCSLATVKRKTTSAQKKISAHVHIEEPNND